MLYEKMGGGDIVGDECLVELREEGRGNEAHK